MLKRLGQTGQTLSVAESCTGWGLGAELTAVPGASSVMLGGVISYSNAVKRDLLGVPVQLLEQHGAVSAPVAEAMALGVRRLTGSDWALSITGIAGPDGGTPDKPVGLVFVGVAGPDGCSTEMLRLGDTRGREWIRTVSAGEVLNGLRLRLMANSAEPGQQKEG